MSLNCNEINLILSEMNLEGAFIQDIIQPGYDTIALYTYKEGEPKTVLICTAQNSVRINETRRKITKNDKPLRFMEFLKAKIRGCRINLCQQIGLERVIKMELSRVVTQEEKSDEKINHIRLAGTEWNTSKNAYSTSTAKTEPEEIIENYILYIRLWNNAANIFLCDENNVILETMYRRPGKNEVKDEVFIIPEIDEEKLEEAKNRFPVRDWNKKEDGALRGSTTDDSAPLEGVAENDSSRADGGCSQGKTFPTFNAFIDWWYGEHASTLSREALLERAEKWYNITHSKQENALLNLRKKAEDFKNADKIKHQGDLIQAYGHLIDGSSNFLECQDYETGETIRLMIDPKKSAYENAAEYYKNYKKAVTGYEQLQHDIVIAENQIKKLDEQYEKIRNEKNPIKIEQLLRHDSTPKQQQKKNHPGLDYTVNGWYILVGRDANENDELLRHNVRGDDLWLHVRDFPGGYVFIKAQKGKTVPLDILLDAANLAVYYSKARNAGKTDLYYTHVKYLRRAKNGPKGLVIPTQEKNLCITPDKARLSRLDSLHEDSI